MGYQTMGGVPDPGWGCQIVDRIPDCGWGARSWMGYQTGVVYQIGYQSGHYFHLTPQGGMKH